jgi:hypothetical protein
MSWHNQKYKGTTMRIEIGSNNATHLFPAFENAVISSQNMPFTKITGPAGEELAKVPQDQITQPVTITNPSPSPYGSGYLGAHYFAPNGPFRLMANDFTLNFSDLPTRQTVKESSGGIKNFHIIVGPNMDKLFDPEALKKTDDNRRTVDFTATGQTHKVIFKTEHGSVEGSDNFLKLTFLDGVSFNITKDAQNKGTITATRA